MLISSPQPAASLTVRTQEPGRQQRPTLPGNLYAKAADALRQGNLQGARQQLDSIAAQHPDQAAQAQVVAGLYAHQAGNAQLAGELLAAAPAPGGSLEDWRLYVLAESAAKSGDADAAQVHYSRLIADYPDSPLRPAAFLEAAELAASSQPQVALGLITRAREAKVDGQLGEDLERLAWKIGRQLEDAQVQREAGRRILIANPLSADAAQVVHTFRAPDGGIDWAHLLSPGRAAPRPVVPRRQQLAGGDPHS